MQNIKCNFSGIYLQEDFLDGTVLDFTSLEETRCYCSPRSADIIRAALAPYGPGGVHWLDSGDYHYVSLFIQEMIEEPYSLVLFDNHPDDQEPAFGGVLSCGSWVKELRANPLVTDVWTLGPDHRIRGAEVDRELEEDIDDLLEALEGKRVYLSIDKDVLRREESRTDWSQGSYSLETLAGWLRKLMRMDVVAIDLCGEIAPAKGATPEDIRINGGTNRFLQELLLDCLK